MAATNRYRKGPMPPLSSIYTQMWPPKPQFTEEHVPDLSGKVYMVTGGSSGVGKEIVRILYSKNAIVYIGARSEVRANQVIKEAQSRSPRSNGSVHFLHMDFANLTTVKLAVEKFKSQESQLHVLINNAGIMSSLENHKTTQGYEIHLGVNVLGPFLLTKLLIPTISETSKLDSNVRVIWVGSLSIELLGELSRGISEAYLLYYPTISPLQRYGISKASSWLYGSEMASRFPEITSVICNPGHLRSDLYRDQNRLLRCILNSTVLYPAVYGALTVLVAATSPIVEKKDSGRWMVPWGRWGNIRKDLLDATRSEGEGGNGHSMEFWDWSSELIKPYL